MSIDTGFMIAPRQTRYHSDSLGNLFPQLIRTLTHFRSERLNKRGLRADKYDVSLAPTFLCS